MLSFAPGFNKERENECEVETVCPVYHPDTKGMNGVWRGQQEKPKEGKKKRKKATTKMGGKRNRNHRGPLKRERKETREEKAGGKGPR